MKRVLLPGPIPPIATEILSAEVELIRGDELTLDDLNAALPTVEGMFVRGPAVLPQHWVEGATRLEVIGTCGSGTNRIPVAFATERGVPVIHAAGASYMSVAEHAVGLMISVSKLIGYFDRSFHIHKTYPEPPTTLSMHQLHGKTIGIVGFGFIGRDLAAKCRAAFSMQVLAYDPYYLVFEAARQGVELTRSLDDMLPRCDFVAITCPLTNETRDLMRSHHLRMMKSTAYLIVVSRGGIVNEEEMVEALAGGTIAGAGIDVWDPEPARPDHPLYSFENVVLTPHKAGGTVEDNEQIARAVATQVLQALRGERPDHIDNPEVWPVGAPRAACMSGR